MNVLERKYRSLLVSVLLGIAAGLLLIYFELQSHEDAEEHRVQISLASRQRMLAQRMLRTQLEMVATPLDDPDLRSLQKRLESDATEFDSVLRVLIDGSHGADALGERVPQSQWVHSAGAGTTLGRSGALWETYFPLLRTLGTSFDVSSVSMTPVRTFALEHTDEFQDLMDALAEQINLHERDAIQSRLTLQACLIGGVLAIAALQILSVWRIRRAEAKEKGRLQHVADQLGGELGRTEAQLRDLMLVSPDLVWAKDVHGNYQMCGQAYLQFTARAASELVGRSGLDLYEAQQSDLERARDAKLMAQGQSTHVEAQLTATRSGKVGLFEIVRTPLFDGDGHPAGVQTVARDITLRKEAEQALAASRQRLLLFEKCLENLNDAILITEAEPRSEPGPRIVYANKAFERMTGFSPQEVLGRNPRMLQGPATDQRELARMHDALFAWRSERMEVINYAKDGREFWVEVAVTPIADGSNGDWYTHWVAVQRDVTERKRNERKQAQLFEQASESSRMKSSFMATVSHEIRTPMNGVIGISELLEDTALDVEQRGYVGMIRQSADALMVIINDILDFSKIESGQLRIASQLFELSPVIGAVATLMDTQARSKDLTFRAVMAPDVPYFMHSDPGRLRQVLINLIGNAIKFTPTGSVELVVSSPRDAAGLAHVRFEVRDSGIGIPAGAQTQLFQPFHQVDGSNARKYAGTGLGLAISRQLVERMGGRIGVESAPDVGSMFWFELPVAGNTDPSMKDA